MIFDPFPVFLPAQYRVKFATEAWERRAAAALRRQVFCDEQGIFASDDHDEIDAIAIPIVAISSLGVALDEVVGTVRIHQTEPGEWWGSRLAVAADYRRIGALGSSLVRLAVSSAHARGCKRFFAHVQSQNTLLFQRLHWTSLGEVEFHGRPHHFMQADLAHYPPFADAEIGFLSLPTRKAA
jgi:putative N-acetyltransferase (TIGR04045 family)